MSVFDVPRDLLEKYSTSAPRYTSYPTAVDWNDEFEPTSYPQLLQESASTQDPLSLYLHIPFCVERCLFCGCNVVITRNEDRVETYLSALETEIDFVKESGIGRRKIRQYHWGGGTPTHLNLQQIERVQKRIQSVFEFTDDAEVAIEVDPRVTTVEQIELLAQLGFNRISLGVQDFDTKVQIDIKRVQSEEQTRRVIDAARAQGMGSLNIDLMYGLPHQTLAGFEKTVRTVLDIRPERVALFHYAHVPWIKKHQTAMTLDAIPSSEDKLAIFCRAIELFRDAGYDYIGLDHFALPDDELAVAQSRGELNRNFMGYTTRATGDMLSLGVSSIGEIGGAFVQNSPSDREYEQLVQERSYATIRGHRSSPEDRLRRSVILDLMCNGAYLKSKSELEFGVNFDQHFATELAELEPLAADGLVLLKPDEVRLTELGQLFMRNVAVPFDAYLRERKASGGTGSGTFSKTL